MIAGELPSPRVRARFGAVVVLVLVAAAIAVGVTAFGNPGNSRMIESTVPPVAGGEDPADEGAAGPQPPDTSVFVHVVGAVANPGLYEVSEGARVVDAIAAAGGLTEQADQGRINLARIVSDGEQLMVPAVGDPDQGESVAAPGLTGGKVNLNLADAATLQTLPRIGPSMAARIIQWRTANGRFTTIEDLRGVTGIGDKTFDALRDLVTV